MLTIQIVAVGKLKEKYLQQGCDEYIKRLSAFCKVHSTEIPPARLPENPSATEIQNALAEEAVKIAEKVKGCFVIPLCIEGELLSSEQLAQKITQLTVQSVSSIAFVIGGSHGLDTSIKKMSGLKLSMSKMTFPHQLARMMLLEQVYRAHMIIGGGKYHK